MNRSEASRRFKDFIFGPEVEGTVTAYLPSKEDLVHRFAVKTPNGEIIDAYICDVVSFYGLFDYFREPVQRGQKIKLRAVKIKPWIDGQII